MLLPDLGGANPEGQQYYWTSQVLKQEARTLPRLSVLQPTPLGVTEKLPTWMPGRYPFAAVNVYLRNHLVIFLCFSGFYFAKPCRGGWNSLGWCFQGQGTEGKRLWTGG